jgi:CheY-like chemotaxis protein
MITPLVSPSHRTRSRGLPRSVVLVAEDDLATRESLVAALFANDLDVLEAEDEGDAVDQLAARRIDAAIVGLHLPARGGCQLIRRMRAGADGSHIRIVAFASSIEGAPVERAWSAGADAVMLEPESTDVVVRAAVGLGGGGR